MIKRIQRKRTKGFKLPLKTLCVSRPSIWGNPYPLAEFGGLALPLFRNTVLGIWKPSLLDGKSESLLSRAYDLHHTWQRQFQYHHPLDVLRSTLREYEFIACWCEEDAPCHGDILIELADAETVIRWPIEQGMVA